MALVEYAYRASRKRSLVREKELGHSWTDRLTSKTSSPITALEDEIYQLRTRMEQMFIREETLTSPLVVEISMMLDEKINQFMRISK